MDISKTLEAYEVEFHILHEELVTGGKGESPQQEGGDLVRLVGGPVVVGGRIDGDI